jgi:nucleoside-diphosphate-sugar epimerase
MSRVLVTGASGFIGRRTLEPLLRRGYEVHAAVRRPPAAPGLHWHAADLLDAGALAALLQQVRPTHLLHLAWYAEPGAFWNSAENLRWVAATQQLLESFHAAGGRRAVLAGSCAEYEATAGDCDELITPVRPATVYGKCKAATRLWFEAYCAHTGLSGAWARVFHLYGPEEDPRRLVASICKGLLAGEPVLCTHGRQVRDFLNVHDAGDALACLLDSAVGGDINLGSGEPVTVAAVAQSLAAMAGRPELLRLGARPAPPGEPERLVPALRRLGGELGWHPVRDLAAGLAQTLDWWQHTSSGTKVVIQ